jgi:hypothetical protein
MGFNNEMERYMRDRRRRTTQYSINSPEGPSWWNKVFFPKPETPSGELTPDEIAKVTAMEQDLKKGEERLEEAETPEQHEELAEKQEARVGLYEKFLGMFKVERKMEDEYESIAGEQLHGNAPADPNATEDFKTLARIQLRWFDRMPTRVKDEFKESTDYAKYKEILQRRGVVKK